MGKKYKGGCQCGAVQFEIDGELGHASICHCRMCQKAFGNYFAPLVSVDADQIHWKGPKPNLFASSNVVNRGFCEKCGTPLTYEVKGTVSLAIGAFDHPEQIAPTIQYGCEGRISIFDNINEIPRHRTDEFFDEAPYLKQIISFQRADED